MKREVECGTCANVALWAPWGFLAVGAGISLIPSLSPFWHKGASYLIAAAFLLMAISVIRGAARSSHRDA